MVIIFILYAQTATNKQSNHAQYYVIIFTYTNQNQTIDNTDGRATLTYTVGVNEIYNINSSWGVGLNINYTNLGTAQTRYKYSGISSTIKAKPQNNDFGVGLSVKYSF